MRIVSVNNRDTKIKFLDTTRIIYKEDKVWVCPFDNDIEAIFDPDKNPYFKHGDAERWILIDDNKKPVGRIAAFIDNNLAGSYDQPTGGMGFFECINDIHAAFKLFDTAKEWLKKHQFNIMRGPANPTSNDEYGALIEGFNDTPRLLTSYNPKYYLNLFDGYGLKKAKDLYAYDIQNVDMLKNEKIKRVAEIVRKRYSVNIRSVNMKDFKNELEIFKKIYNKTWEANWGFVPMSDAEIDAAAADLKPLINKDLVFFAEINNEPIGVVLAMPDYNEIFKTMKGRLFPFQFIKLYTQKKKITWARIIALGVIPEHQKKGIDGLLYYESLVRAAKHGIMQGEASWILEDNVMMNRGAETMNGKIYKKYRIYDIPI